MALPTFFVSGNVIGNTAAASIPWPAGHQADDLGLLFVTTKNQPLGAIPAGWAHIPGSPFGTGVAGAADAIALNVLWKRATSGAEADANVGDSGDHQLGSIQTYRGVTTSGDPWDQISSDVDAVADDDVTIPGHTTTGTDRLVVHAVANGVDSSTDVFNGSFANASLGSLSVRVNVNTTQGLGSGFAIGTGTKTAAGAIANTTGDLTVNSKQARVMISLKPISLAKTLVAGVGVFVTVTNPATMKTTSVIQADTGVFAMTGNDATFEKHLGRVITAETGIFNLTGIEVNMRRHIGAWTIERPLAIPSEWTPEPPLEQ